MNLLDGTVLELRFQDGAVKRYDMAALFTKYPQLTALQNRDLFLQGRLQGSYGVIWNDALDIEAETIYEEGVTVLTEDVSLAWKTGNALAEARSARGLTQSQLAEKSGIDQSDISKIERGQANPSVSTLQRLAEALGCKINICFDLAQN